MSIMSWDAAIQFRDGKAWRYLLSPENTLNDEYGEWLFTDSLPGCLALCEDDAEQMGYHLPVIVLACPPTEADRDILALIP